MLEVASKELVDRIRDERSYPLVMGILNVTPDSFYDGGRYKHIYDALKRVERMIAEGVDVVDIGGESTRPFSERVPLEEELRRVIPVIEGIRRYFPDLTLSIDTYKAKVAEEALVRGVSILNDVSALRFDPEMIDVVRKFHPVVVLMHMKGTPQDMQINPVYEDVVGEVKAFLCERKNFLLQAGLSEEKVVVDPGIGFGKTLKDNLVLLKNISVFSEIAPVLVGPSRKSFIGELLSVPPAERLEGTLSAVSIAVYNGARIVRVHDVKEAKRAAYVAKAVRDA